MASSQFSTALAFSLTLGFLVGFPFNAPARAGGYSPHSSSSKSSHRSVTPP